MSIRLKTYDGKELTFSIVPESHYNKSEINLNKIEEIGNNLIPPDLIGNRVFKTGDSNVFLQGYTPKWGGSDKLPTDDTIVYFSQIQLTEHYRLEITQKRGNVGTFQWRFRIFNINTKKDIVSTSGHINYPTIENYISVYSAFNTQHLSTPNATIFLSNVSEKGSITSLKLGSSHFETGSYGATILGQYYIGSTATINNDTREFFNELNQLEQWYDPEPITPPIDTNGTYDNTSDEILLPDIDNINLVSALSSNLIKAYNVGASEMSQFSAFLWSDNYTNSIIKNQNSPIDNIQKCYLIPYEIEESTEDYDLIVGNVAFKNSNDENIKCKKITKQFNEIDFGNIELKEYYGNFMDYDSEIEIFLPFIGTQKLDIDDIMNATINLKYRYDVLTGNCIAIITSVKSAFNTELNSVLYTFTGNIANEVPLSQQINQSMVNRNNIMTEMFTNPFKMLGGIATLLKEDITSYQYGNQYSVHHTGNLSSNNGFMGIYYPYLIIKRQINVNPQNYNNYNGLPTFYTSNLSDVKGYVEIDRIISTQPSNIPLPLWDDIIAKLKNGVIIN